MMTEVLFWTSFFLIFYCYLGYPMLLLIWSRFFTRKVTKSEELPRVTLLIAAYNEAAYIQDKIRNALAMDYPSGQLEVLVGSDGSTDGTEKLARQIKDSRVRVIHWNKRRGKISVINSLVPKAKGEIVVFSDCRQMYFPDAIRQLVMNLADPQVGCVSGSLEILPLSRKSFDEGVGFYRIYEQFLRNLEGKIHSMLGATGAIYAVKKRLFSPPPLDTILDDFEIPLRIVEKGYRAVFEPLAIAYDFPPGTPQEEMSRKVRTLAGNYQSLPRLKRLLHPFRSPIALQLFSHKVLRLLTPFLMILVFVLNLKLASHSDLYLCLFCGQLTFYWLGGFGSILRVKGRLRRVFGIASAFILLNYAALLGCFRFLTGRQQVMWQKATADG